MKKRILTLGAVLVFVTVLVVPSSVLAADTTVVSGTVIGIYIFEAPSAVEFGDMGPSDSDWYAHTWTPGYFFGNSPAGYTVTGADIKATNTGYMTSGGGTPLTNKLQICDIEYGEYVDADTGITYVDSSGPASESIDLYATQVVEVYDTPGSYSLNITFTVVEKT